MDEPKQKNSPIKKPVPEVVAITDDDDDDVKMISEKMSTEKLPSKTKKTTQVENQSTIKKDISQESLVKKLSENKIQDSEVDQAKPKSTQKRRLRKICDESEDDQPKKVPIINQNLT